MNQLKVERRGQVGLVRVSNPARRNAMTLAMWQAFPIVLRQLDDDPLVRVIALEGDGDDFVSGSDVSEFSDIRNDPASQALYDEAIEAAFAVPGQCAKPVLARIRGVCYGGGVGIATACDVRLCDETARFRLPVARLGLGYSASACARLVDAVGSQHAADLLLSARRIDAACAERIGLVARSIESSRFAVETGQWLDAVATNAPLSLRAMKAMLRGRGAQAVGQAVAACFASKDYQEGQRAVAEGREPVFHGR